MAFLSSLPHSLHPQRSALIAIAASCGVLVTAGVTLLASPKGFSRASIELDRANGGACFEVEPVAKLALALLNDIEAWRSQGGPFAHSERGQVRLGVLNGVESMLGELLAPVEKSEIWAAGGGVNGGSQPSRGSAP